MIENRFPPVTIKIGIACASIAIIQFIASTFFFHGVDGNSLITKYFGLSLDGLLHGYIWQLATYTFLHSNLMHIILNMFTLFFMGSSVEYFLGGKRYFILFIITSIVGGLGWLLINQIEISYAKSIFEKLVNDTPVTVQQLGWAYKIYYENSVIQTCVGASAGVFGLIGAFIAICPRRRITLLLFYFIPISLEARYFGIILAVISVSSMISSTDNVAHAAHLFGGLLGYILVKLVPYFRPRNWYF